MLGTEWSLSFPRLMCARALLSHTSGPHSSPLSKSSPTRSHPSISQRGLLQGSTRDWRLSPQCSANHLEPGPSPALGFPANPQAPSAPRVSLTGPASASAALCRCPSPRLPLCYWAGCPATLSSLPLLAQSPAKSFCGQKLERYKFWVTQ